MIVKELKENNQTYTDLKQSNNGSAAPILPSNLEQLQPGNFVFMPSQDLVNMYKDLSKLVEDFVSLNNEYIQIKIQEEKAKVRTHSKIYLIFVNYFPYRTKSKSRLNLKMLASTRQAWPRYLQVAKSSRRSLWKVKSSGPSINSSKASQRKSAKRCTIGFLQPLVSRN